MRYTETREIKIFILYLMQRIGYPVHPSDIAAIMHSENVADVFTASQCIDELIKQGHIFDAGVKDEKGNELYAVSSNGSFIANELSDMIDDHIKERAYRSAIRFISFERRGASVHTNLEESPSGNGKYMVHCEIDERGKKVLEINVEVDSKIEAELMVRNFRRKPEVVFEGTLALVSGEVNYIFE